MKNRLLSQREEDMLEILWKMDDAQTTMNLEKVLENDNEWNRLSIFRTVKQLINKGYVEVCGVKQKGRQIAREFKASMTKEEYVAQKMRHSGIDMDNFKNVAVAFVKTENGEDTDVAIRILEQAIEELRGKNK